MTFPCYFPHKSALHFFLYKVRLLSITFLGSADEQMNCKVLDFWTWRTGIAFQSLVQPWHQNYGNGIDETKISSDWLLQYPDHKHYSHFLPPVLCFPFYRRKNVIYEEVLEGVILRKVGLYGYSGLCVCTLNLTDRQSLGIQVIWSFWSFWYI